MRFSSIKKFNPFELLICYTHNSNFSICGNKCRNSFNMYFHIFFTTTMTYINRKLKHCKSIFQ